MFSRILIANRGEIAVRIIRACRELGVETVAVYSEADSDALHTQMADSAVCIGGPQSKDSYLNTQNILSAAVKTGSQAIHPGFGFLAENSRFAAMCKELKLSFIGPSPDVIDMMGNKANARRLMIKAGVPVIPGSDGLISSVSEAEGFAGKAGYPVMIKASAGGGGKGIRIVRKKDELAQAFSSAKAEARVNFGDDALYMEKLIENAKHIEVQILADKSGNTVHLGERDCSMQRRNQKLIEEAPALTLSPETRRAMGEAAVRAAKAVGYESAGTIEFLYSKGEFYFMEMNTRIQVEHPVTEAVTGIDIVKQQVMIAAGESLSFTQGDVGFSGHSIECRINAECPERGFAPSPGRIDYLLLPSGCLGLRVDSAAFAGYTIPPYYDSMIAKVITHGRDRSEAISIMRRALSEFVITGVETNIDFQLKLLANEKFLLGEADTGLIARELS